LKTEFIAGNPRVCAMIVQDNGYQQGESEHAYRSVVIRGNMETVTGESEKRKALDVLLDHLEENSEIMRVKLREKTQRIREVRILKLVIGEISEKEGNDVNWVDVNV
jgi:uncharacterized protein